MGFLESINRYRSVYKNYLHIMFELYKQKHIVDSTVKGYCKVPLPKIDIVHKDGYKDSLTPLTCMGGFRY
jgi:hypothetical protein